MRSSFSIVLIVLSLFILNIAHGKEYVVNKIISGDTIQLGYRRDSEIHRNRSAGIKHERRGT